MIALLLFLVLSLAPANAIAQKVPGVEVDGGAYFQGDAAIALLEALRDADAANDKIRALLNENAAKDQQIAELENSKKSADIAIAKAELIMENWKLIDDTRRAVIDEYKTALEQVRETNKQLVEAAKQAESKAWWDKLWSTVVIGFVGIAGFFH